MSVRNTFYPASFTSLFENRELADIKFVVKKKNGGQLSIPAHKFILAFSSPVFRQMFYGDLQEGAVVNINDVTAEAFSEFLQFFYKPEILLTPENIAVVLKLIDKYDTPCCYPVCEVFLMNSVTSQLAYCYFELAHSFQLSACLIDKLEDIICKNMNVVFENGHPGGSEQKMLREILRSNKLKATPMDIFNGATTWATVSLQNKGQLITVNSIKHELGDCFNRIPFQNMELNEFLGCLKGYPNILEPGQYFAILDTIAQNELTRNRTESSQPIVVPFVLDIVSFVCRDATRILFDIEKRCCKNIAFVGFEIMISAIQCPTNVSCEYQLKICTINNIQTVSNSVRLSQAPIKISSPLKHTFRCEADPVLIHSAVGENTECVFVLIFDSNIRSFSFISSDVDIIHGVRIRFPETDHSFVSKFLFKEFK